MLIVIPGALPAAAVAPELARLLPQHAPTLHGWLQAASARVQAFDAARQGCTPSRAGSSNRPATNPSPACRWAPASARCAPPAVRPASRSGWPTWRT